MVRRRLTGLALLGFAGSLLSCNVVERATSQGTSKEAEARKVAGKLFELTFKKCGDDYYEHHTLENFVQYKMIGLELKEVPLNDADAANGVDMKFVAVGKCRMLRNWTGDTWSDWRQQDSFLAPKCEMQDAVYMIRRQNGQWQNGLSGRPLTFDPDKSKPRCKDIPGYNGPERDAEIKAEIAKRREDLDRPLDIQNYCNLSYGKAAQAVNSDPNNPYTWRCKGEQAWYNKTVPYFEVDMNKACERQYGNEFKAIPRGGANPDWRCVYKEPVH